MAYSTGSGSYTALMSAVLAHALTDGWTEAGGPSSGWPIISPSGRVRGVDWATSTALENDLTLGGDGIPKTQRYITLGLGTSGANATTNAPSGPQVPNMAYTFSEWHIFSEPALNDHIHVVVKFSNGVNNDCFSHFSFGEVDKGGLTYNSIAYATTTDRRAYAVTAAGGVSATDNALGEDWNTLNRCGNMWAGNFGENDDGWSSASFMTHATTAPHPNGSAGWPAHDTHILAGTNLWASIMRQNDRAIPSLTPDLDGHFAQAAWWRGLNSQTGYVPLAPIPFLMINGELSSSKLRWMGIYPNVRFASMEGINPGDEFTFASDTWKIFPMTRATPWSELNIRYRITSGFAGFAYKKVV